MANQTCAALTVHIFTAGGALPVSDAWIRLSGNFDEEVYDRTRLSDRAGICVFSEVPCPPRENSLSPGGAQSAFSTYDLEIYHEGFFPKVIRNLAFFEGIETIQNVDLIPYARFHGEPMYPRGNLVVNSAENENLL